MTLELILFGILFLAAIWMGYRQLLKLRHLNRKRVIRLFTAGLLILIIMSFLHITGIFTQPVAARTTMSFYTIAAGFFFGLGIKLIIIRRKMGRVNYMHRSFWTDIAPNLVAVMLVAFGIYRTGILTLGPFTGIGITSGISLVAFGFWGWTVRVVPEFRDQGLLMLDEFVEWKKVIAYEWITDDSLQLDYLTGEGKISEFNTYIPPEDQLIVERLMAQKMHQHEEERKKAVAESDEN